MHAIRHTCTLIVILAVLFLLPGICVAQVSTVAGAINGIVSDTGGAVISNARVILRNAEPGQTRELGTADEGEFRASELPAAIYEVSVLCAGFATYHHSGVNVLMGRTVRLNITLQPETVRDEVTVTTQPDALEPTRTTLVTNVEAEQIAGLPVQSRNYLNFVLLAPGVSNSQTS